MAKIKIGVIGGAGYTAGELLRLLLNHPEAEIAFVHSSSNAGRLLSDVHTGLIGETDLRFSDSHPLDEIDLLFLCSAHGASRDFWNSNVRPEGLKVIDLAQDFRDESNGYVYGLPEVNRGRIGGSDSIANPGCFATAIQLGLAPLAAARKLHGEVNIVALTGATGAGVKPSASTHFAWRADNISVYKPFRHQHLTEIGMTLSALDPNADFRLTFIPMRGDFARGIFATITLQADLSEEEARQLYEDFYRDAPFTFVSSEPIFLKQVVNTNKALIHVDADDGRLLITVAEDNLLKGASGQAVQNMNLIFGLPERTGLALKSSAF